MLKFEKVKTENSSIPDYHIHDLAGGDYSYLGRIIYYSYTNEWMYQSPMHSVIMTKNEFEEVNRFIKGLGGF